MEHTDRRLGFIGGGNMASAIIKGILHGEALAACELSVFDTSEQTCTAFCELGVHIPKSTVALVQNCRFVVLSVKPQVVPQVLAEIAPYLTPQHVIVSIAAGITVASIHKAVGVACAVVPVMPNTPLLIGCGAVAIAKVPPIADTDFNFVRSLFELSGTVALIEADKLNEVIPINGSSPAFIYLMAKTMAEYGETQGIDRNTSMHLFCHTLIGSAKMLLESGKTPDELITAVCSPGGATLKGLEALERNGFCGALVAAGDACIKRAYELGGKAGKPVLNSDSTTSAAIQ